MVELNELIFVLLGLNTCNVISNSNMAFPSSPMHIYLPENRQEDNFCVFFSSNLAFAR